jgi:sortase A
MSYIYVKKSSTPSETTALRRVHYAHHFVKQKKRYFAFVLFSIGIFFFASVAFPIIQFQVEYAVRFNQVINPLSSKFYNHSGNILGELTTDYTQLNNWFVSDSGFISPPLTSHPSTSYLLTIPSLKIDNAIVDVGSMDLKKSLIQYPQTALPGQAGNSVIFGHSVLPQFFSSKSYLTIFSTLYKLKQGDEIFIDYDNIRYKYLVEELFEVQPTDLSVLEQRFDGRYLSLITCSPPGTTLRRLVVKAQIVDI